MHGEHHSEVGIVGLGAMGAAVAARLHAQGWKVVVWNRSAAPVADFIARVGGRAAATPRDCAATGRVITFVANDGALKDVVNGTNGILAGLPDEGVHISMSSVSPALITDLAERHDDRLIAAPVFGRPEAATNGLLWVALSGPDLAVQRVRGMLSDYSRKVYEFGADPAAAQRVKIAGNLMIAAAIEAMSEAFAMLEATGTDVHAFHDMMSDSIFESVIHKNYGTIILNETFDPPGFKLALGRKDVGLAIDLANVVGTSLPFGEILARRFALAVEAGLGDLDWTAISVGVRRT